MKVSRVAPVALLCLLSSFCWGHDVVTDNNSPAENIPHQGQSVTHQCITHDALEMAIQAAIQDVNSNMDAFEERMTKRLENLTDTVATTCARVLENDTQVMAPDAPSLESETKPASSCADVQQRSNTGSGVYTIDVLGKKMKVYCELTTDGGGWTVIQRRRDEIDPRVDFYGDWSDYKTGFGDLEGEFWIGLDNIHALTSVVPVRLRVDLEDWEGEKRFAEYDTFRVADEEDKCRLLVEGFNQERGGGAGDSLTQHSGKYFTTKDRDNDDSTSSNVALTYSGAWWYHTSYNSNLNGLYLSRSHPDQYAKGVNWGTWKGYTYSLAKVQMKIRPRSW